MQMPVHLDSTSSSESEDEAPPLVIPLHKANRDGASVSETVEAFLHEVEHVAESVEERKEASSSRRHTSTTNTQQKSTGTIRHCRCKASGCLKAYCACFAVGVMCTGSCLCTGCSNDDATSKRKERRESILKKRAIAYPTRETCTCTRSGCHKAYCICWKRGRRCSDECECVGCRNPYGARAQTRPLEASSAGRTEEVYEEEGRRGHLKGIESSKPTRKHARIHGRKGEDSSWLAQLGTGDASLYCIAVDAPAPSNAPRRLRRSVRNGALAAENDAGEIELKGEEVKVEALAEATGLEAEVEAVEYTMETLPVAEQDSGQPPPRQDDEATAMFEAAKTSDTAATRKLEEIRQQLKCGVCLNVLSEPHTVTTCQHSFCYVCLQELFEGPPRRRGGSMRCPINGCNNSARWRDVMRNQQLAHLVEILEA